MANRDRNLTEGKLRRELDASQERLEQYLWERDSNDETESGSGAAAAVDLAQRIAALRKR